MAEVDQQKRIEQAIEQEAMAEAITGDGGDLLSAAQSSVENDYEKTQ